MQRSSEARRPRSGLGMRALWCVMCVVVTLQIFLLSNGVRPAQETVDNVPPSHLLSSLREDAARLEHAVVSSAAPAFAGSVREEIVRLKDAMAKLTCSTIFTSQNGLCHASAGIKPHASTADKAVLRPTGYKRNHRVWREARDHWATQAMTKEAGASPFKMNTHDPEQEDRFISRAVHHHTIWDEYVFNVLKYVLVTKGLPPSRVIDVGGNIGYFSMWALAMGHRVTTFEPMDYNLLKIVSSIAANGFSDRHTLYQNAVGNAPGRVLLQPTNKINRGNFQIQPLLGNSATDQGDYGVDYVDTVRLSDVVDEDVLFIKIDVEGYEHKVLDGARRLICSRVVRYIELEFTTAKGDHDCNAHQVLCWFELLGYRISRVDDIAALETGNNKGKAVRELASSAWQSFDSEILLSLRDPLLPPMLALEYSGAWPNPCRDISPAREHEHWTPYKQKWCLAMFAQYSSSFVPCARWGAFPADVQRTYSGDGLACDALLGFECGGMTLAVQTLEDIEKRSPAHLLPGSTVKSDWLPQ